MGKDCFVVKIACDLESCTVILFRISVILRRSLVPRGLHFQLHKSFETLLFLTGTYRHFEKNTECLVLSLQFTQELGDCFPVFKSGLALRLSPDCMLG